MFIKIYLKLVGWLVVENPLTTTYKIQMNGRKLHELLYYYMFIIIECSRYKLILHTYIFILMQKKISRANLPSSL